MPAAVSISSVFDQTTKVIAPLIAAATMAFWHGQVAYYLVSAMAVLSLACVLRLRGIVASGPKQPARKRLPAGRFRQLYLMFQADPIIRGALLLVAAGICTMSMLLYIKRWFGLSQA